MESSIQVFSNENFTVRTKQDADGTVWFVAKDIAQALEYSEASNPARLFQSVPDVWTGVKRFHISSENGIVQSRDMLCLTEQGVYFFLGRSDKPKALPYQMWIAGEVVPNIMHTGSYSTDNRANREVSEFQWQQLNLERAKFLQHIIDAPPFPLTNESKAVIQHEAFKLVTGHEYLAMLPECTEKWYTATDIGEHFGISANMVGRIAKKYGIKAPEGESNEYGRWIFSKSRHSSREVPSFIYSEAGFEWFEDYEKGLCKDVI